MVVCWYYLQGTCKFGNRCRNEHPPGLEGSAARNGPGAIESQQQQQQQLPPGGFGMVSGNAPGNSTVGGGSGGGPRPPHLARGPNAPRRSMFDWWEEGRQAGTWPLSSYGNTYAPCTVRGVDVSPEELRAEAYAAVQLMGATQEQVAEHEAMRVQEALRTAAEMLQRPPSAAGGAPMRSRWNAQPPNRMANGMSAGDRRDDGGGGAPPLMPSPGAAPQFAAPPHPPPPNYGPQFGAIPTPPPPPPHPQNQHASPAPLPPPAAEAFGKPEFERGAVPDVPPPAHLC
ncbi:hypothetical protein CDCA_CDCA13G3610 [Cyanidium caldarium]|uniref:C3H1-type domain-containing protein n=1 Tax=Cyanidium caldarium TaxID=2771 RepID=A0AAV9IZU4_CYACA|nr:hypothetical protein CDCA_CDCA13G3610 [Cyanidium caldarium]